MSKEIPCPNCGHPVPCYRNPVPTVDIIIRYREGIVLIKRRNEPLGWALPGGFVDYGESLEVAASREAQEETGLSLENLQQFRAYSDPHRDPRQHTLSVVFIADGRGDLSSGDDAAETGIFELDTLPKDLCFDHGQIIADYCASLNEN